MSVISLYWDNKEFSNPIQVSMQKAIRNGRTFYSSSTQSPSEAVFGGRDLWFVLNWSQVISVTVAHGGNVLCWHHFCLTDSW